MAKSWRDLTQVLKRQRPWPVIWSSIDGPEILRLQSLSLPADGPFGVALKDLELSVHGGEIVAIAGIAGNGQSELFASLSGEAPTAAAMISIGGQACGDRDVSGRRR